jgi:hypothetical protein
LLSSEFGHRGGEYSAFLLRCLVLQGRVRHLLGRMMDQNPVCSARYGEHKNCVPLWEIEPKFLGHPGNGLVSVITEYYKLINSSISSSSWKTRKKDISLLNIKLNRELHMKNDCEFLVKHWHTAKHPTVCIFRTVRVFFAEFNMRFMKFQLFMAW